LRTLVALCAFMTLVGASATRAATRDACAFAYADDYSGDAVVVDSYAHSAIVSQFCFMCLGGWLMFVTDSTGNRGLGFYSQTQGYGGQPAFLSYQFPRDGVAGGMVGRVEFDLLSCPTLTGSGAFAWADVQIGYDGVQTTYEHVTQAGHYVYDLNPPPGVAKVYMRITASVIRLDNLLVCLDASTPTKESSWGALKTLYR
jgi:hypothetical protein